MEIALWIVQVLLAGMFGMAGGMKTFQFERARTSLPWVNEVPRSLTTFIGVAEILGAAGLLLPMLTGIQPWLTSAAAVGLAVIMLLAIGFHAMRREWSGIGINVVIVLLAAFVAYGRSGAMPL